MTSTVCVISDRFQGFEIYVKVPLGQPQDLAWLPMEYFGCPSQPLDPVP